MTWSIIAKDSHTGQIGIAVATKFFAVGALVPHIAPRIGGIATQALVNPYYGIDGLKLLREGKHPQDILDALIAADSGAETRQLHIMDASGRIAWDATASTGAAISAATAFPSPATCSRAGACWMTRRQLFSPMRACRFRGDCSRPCAPARQPAGTSAASNRRHF